MAKLTDQQKSDRARTRRLNEALKNEARALQALARRQEWVEKDMYLTREEAAAGALCRGCGKPIFDGLGDWGPTMYLSDEDKIAYDQANLEYRAAHPDCESHRWSVAGSRTDHCGLCCPPLPIPLEVLENLGRLMATSSKPREGELDVWTLELTCGHSADKTQHHTNRSALWSTIECSECDATRGVVTSVRTVDAAARAKEVAAKKHAAIERAERAVKKAEAEAQAARDALAALRGDAPI